LLPKERNRSKKKNPPRLTDLPQRSLPTEQADVVRGGQDLQAYREQLRNLLINSSNVRPLPGHDPPNLTDENPNTS
jgi:hypothetical protein